MKKFVFQEAKLLALRKQQVKVAEVSVTVAQHHAAQAREAVNRQMEAIRNLSEQILNSRRGNVTLLSHTARSLRHSLEESRRQLDDVEDKLAAAIDKLSHAKVAAESLQELESTRRAEYLKYRQKQEQAAIDFHCSRTWSTQRSSAETQATDV